MPSKEERLAAFNAYNFGADEQWKDYFANITIPPDRDEGSVIRRYKQKYYKRHIDPDFELDAPQPSVPPPSRSSSRPEPSSEGLRPRPRPPPQRAAAGPAPPQQRLDGDTIFFLANAIVLVMGLLAAFPFTPQTLASRGFRWCFLASGVANIYSLRQRYGWPRAFTLAALKAWILPVAVSPELLNILSCMVFLPSSRPIALAVVPQACGALLTVAQHLRRNFSQAQLYRAYFEQPCIWLERNQAPLQGVCASTEISLGFLLVFYVFTPQRSMFQTFLHWQLLKAKYQSPATSHQHRQAWASISQKVEPYITQYAPFLNAPIGYVKKWFTTNQ